jgi:hypothetical protein
VLGIWWQDNEGAKFWLAVLNDLRRRGVQDVLIACVDGLKGFPEAIEATFPKAWVQTCIVHLIRSSLRYVNYRDKKKVATALRPPRSSRSRRSCAAPSTRPTQSKGCTARSARPLRPAATSPTNRPRPSSSGWRSSRPTPSGSATAPGQPPAPPLKIHFGDRYPG